MFSIASVFRSPVIRRTIQEIPGAAFDLGKSSVKQTFKGLGIISDTIDAAYGLPGRIVTGFNSAVPKGFSQQVEQALIAKGAPPFLAGAAGFGAAFAEPVGVPGRAGKVLQKAPKTTFQAATFLKPVLQKLSTPQNANLVRNSTKSLGSKTAQSFQLATQSAKQGLVSKISSFPSRLYGRIGGGGSGGLGGGSLGDLTPPNDPVKKVIDALTKAKPLLRKQDAAYRAERARRVAKIAAAGERIPGEQGFFAQLGAAKGQLPKVSFESIRPNVTQRDVDDLFNMVEKSKILSPFEKLSAKGGLAKILGKGGGAVPTRSEIQIMREVFPDEFMQVVLQKRPASDKVLEKLGQAINFPRSVMATADLSAPLRQGIFLVGRPKQFVPAFGDMFKYAASPKAYDGLLDNIQARPTYSLMKQSKLALTDMSKFMNTREEAFMSNWAEQIPGFGVLAKASNRAYSGFLNKLRADVFDDLAKKAITLGIDKQRPEVFDDLARYINSATGRGKLPGKLDRAAVALNSAFFAPRLVMSRINLLNPLYYASLDPFVRKQAIRDLLIFGSTALTIANVAKLAGADVESNPLNSDFGKIRVGDTRYDPYGGFQPYIRVAAQLIAGKSVSPVTGRETVFGEGYKPKTRKDIVEQFFRSKLSPAASFAYDLLKGQDFLGRKIDIPREAVSRLIPLFQQDLYELYQEWGPMGTLLGLPGFFGVGSQTFGNYELVEGENMLGEKTKEVRDRSDLATDIREKLFGKTPLKPTTTGQAQEYYQQLKGIPKEEAAAIFNDILDVNPKLAEKIADAAEMEAKGITVEEQSFKDKGVASGDRAKAIAKKFTTLDQEEKAALWDDYVEKGIITEEVAPQVIELASAGKDGKTTKKSFLETIATYLEAFGADADVTINRLFTGQRILRVENDTVIVERLPYEESQRIREERGANSPEYRLDHYIPLQLGGSNSESNLKIVPTAEHERYTPVENYLGRLLKNGKIGKKQAQELIKKFKDGSTTFEEIQAQTGIQAVNTDFRPKLAQGEGNRPQRNNNPLNIKVSEVTLEYPGVVGADTSPATDGGQFLVFDSPDAGFAAAKRLITNPNYQNLTVEQALRRWSNSDYGAEIIPQFANRTINSLSNEELQALVETMAEKEGYFA